MPNMGIFFSKISLGMFGNFFFVTVEGPPDKIMPFILSKSFILYISSIVIVLKLHLFS